ncbi:x globin isoform X2 [Stegostoma tigrinum]|uniref:x globin isoform X2 n=1 Tax=Stegostoma tigrinum TaxID=3053191 RepID=UPI0028702EC9|nr:x globin isoform X2 [Stegostoma tigrinum]
MGCALSGTGLDPGKAGVDVSSATPRSEAGGSELVASDSYPPLPLSEQQKDLIQQSWKVLHQDIARVGIIMFISVMSFIEKSVARLTQQDKLEQLAFDLGRSHYRYNAPPKYYEYVGVQFIAVVKPILKEKWTADVEEAWKGLFEYLTRTMKRGYHDAEQRDNVNRGNYTKRRAPSALKASQNAV